jgi:hypothetical protein
VKKYSLTNSPQPFFSKLLELLPILISKEFLYKGISAKLFARLQVPHTGVKGFLLLQELEILHRPIPGHRLRLIRDALLASAIRPPSGAMQRVRS